MQFSTSASQNIFELPPPPPGDRIAYGPGEFQFGELRVPEGAGTSPSRHCDPRRLLARRIRPEPHRAFLVRLLPRLPLRRICCLLKCGKESCMALTTASSRFRLAGNMSLPRGRKVTMPRSANCVRRGISN